MEIDLLQLVTIVKYALGLHRKNRKMMETKTFEILSRALFTSRIKNLKRGGQGIFQKFKSNHFFLEYFPSSNHIFQFSSKKMILTDV
jgi:hypothetical protein